MLMGVTIQLIAASQVPELRGVILRPNCAIPSRAARRPAGIEVAFHRASVTHVGEREPEQKDVMTTFKRIAIAALAASTVAVGSFAFSPAAEAAADRPTCICIRGVCACW